MNETQIAINKLREKTINESEIMINRIFNSNEKIESSEIYDRILKEIEVSNISIILMIGLLKNVYLFRLKLNNWQPFLLKAKEEIDKRKENSHKILQGLL